MRTTSPSARTSNPGKFKADKLRRTLLLAVIVAPPLRARGGNQLLALPLHVLFILAQLTELGCGA